jgi:hypothetical protein
MKTIQKICIALLTFGCIGAAATAVADVRIDAYDGFDGHISLQGGDIVITAPDDSEARITDSGDLLIHGDKVAVDETQRTLLRQYVGQVHGLEHQGIKIGSQSVNLAVGVLGEVFSRLYTRLLTGDEDDKDIDENAEARAAGLVDAVRGMCDGMKSLEQLQGRIAGSLSAFKPYAVITDRSVGKCYDGLKEHREV